MTVFLYVKIHFLVLYLLKIIRYYKLITHLSFTFIRNEIRI